MQTRRTARGFTLLEIMVVVVIIGILAALIVPNVIGNIGKAQTERVKADIKTLSGTLEMYKLDNFNLPSTEQGLAALVTKPGGQPEASNWRTGGYLPILPKDPWGTPYQYLQPGQHGQYDVYSLGADKRAGGVDDNADVGNWSE